MNLYDIKNQLYNGKSIYDLPLKVTFYARVSTEKTEQLNSFKNQKIYFTNKIQSNSNWTFIPGYLDEGISGTSISKRVNFNKMLLDAKNNKFNLILTKEVSRFARNTVDSLTTIRELLNYGVGVFFENDNINTFSNEGELRLTIMSSIAQDESRKLSERVKFGHKRSIESGRVLGNNNIWGYKKNNGKLEIVPEEAKIVKRIFTLYSSGNIGIRKIGHELAKENIYTKSGKEFSFSTIKSILTNPKYKGYYSGMKTTTVDFLTKKKIKLSKDNWLVYKDLNGYVPPIVSEELWNKCNYIYKLKSATSHTHDKS